MGFVIDYAPASIAMSLAQQAGRGDRVEREARLRAQQLQQELAQREAVLREQSFAITNALKGEELGLRRGERFAVANPSR